MVCRPNEKRKDGRPALLIPIHDYRSLSGCIPPLSSQAMVFSSRWRRNKPTSRTSLRFIIPGAGKKTGLSGRPEGNIVLVGAIFFI